MKNLFDVQRLVCVLSLSVNFKFLSSNHSSKWRSSTVQRDPDATLASTVTRNQQKRAAAATRSLSTLRNLAGIGSLHPNATEPTTARGSASSCTCSSIHMLTWWTKPTHGAPRGPAARPPRCHPSTCSTSTERSRSSTERSRLWWSTTVAAHEENILQDYRLHHRSADFSESGANIWKCCKKNSNLDTVVYGKKQINSFCRRVFLRKGLQTFYTLFFYPNTKKQQQYVTQTQHQFCTNLNLWIRCS